MTKCEDCKYESERQVPPRPFKYCLYFNRKIKKQFLDGTADCPKFEPTVAMLSTPLTPVKVPVIIEYGAVDDPTPPSEEVYETKVKKKSRKKRRSKKSTTL